MNPFLYTELISNQFSMRLSLLVLVVTLLFTACASNNKDVMVEGLVRSVTTGGQGDIVVALENVRGIHYIREENANPNPEQLSALLVGKRVKLEYLPPVELSKISPATETRLIKRIQLNDSLVYERAN